MPRNTRKIVLAAVFAIAFLNSLGCAQRRHENVRVEEFQREGGVSDQDPEDVRDE